MYDYDPDKKPKTPKSERDEQMKKFLAKGGKVQKLEPGYPLDVCILDKSRKPRYTKEEIKNFKPSAAPLPNYNTDKPSCSSMISLGNSYGIICLPFY